LERAAVRRPRARSGDRPRGLTGSHPHPTSRRIQIRRKASAVRRTGDSHPATATPLSRTTPSSRESRAERCSPEGLGPDAGPAPGPGPDAGRQVEARQAAAQQVEARQAEARQAAAQQVEARAPGRASQREPWRPFSSSGRRAWLSSWSRALRSYEQSSSPRASRISSLFWPSWPSSLSEL
jgi:hypothetical protein